MKTLVRYMREWPEAPILLPRLSLVLSYLVGVYIGILAIIAGVPVFDLTQPRGYAVIWGGLLALSALVSAIGATNIHWHVLERWAVLSFVSLLVAYVGALNGVAVFSHDLDRYVAGGVATGYFLISVSRFLYLAKQAGKRKRESA